VIFAARTCTGFTSILGQMSTDCKSKENAGCGSCLWRTHTLLKSFLGFQGLYHLSRKGQFYFKASNHCISSESSASSSFHLQGSFSAPYIHQHVTIKGEECPTDTPSERDSRSEYASTSCLFHHLES
jgi:hypothetical protein